jgi:hypothetical protein
LDQSEQIRVSDPSPEPERRRHGPWFDQLDQVINRAFWQSQFPGTVVSWQLAATCTFECGANSLAMSSARL